MNALDIPDDNFTSFRQVEHDYIGYQSLTDVPKALQYIEDNSIKIEVNQMTYIYRIQSTKVTMYYYRIIKIKAYRIYWRELLPLTVFT